MERDRSPAEPIPRLAPYPEIETEASWRQSARPKIFVIVAALTLTIGLVLTALQPSVFRASATVLMTAPVAIDDQDQEANVQSVAIQRRILLGGEVTEALLAELHDQGYPDINLRYLRETLSVDPVVDTNLVEMGAQGAEKDLLPGLVDTWIDVYLDVRAAGIQQSQQQTLRMVRDQLAGLDVKLEEAREALALYREEHNITSAERQENEVVARLEGLNDSLNKAIENEVFAAARVESMRSALAQGKQIVAASDRESVAAMETELRKLQNQLKNLMKTFTLDYVRKQPRYRNIPDRIAELEQDLEAVYAEGEDLELSLARQQHAAAQQTVQQLREQLSEREKDAARFTTIYATHEALAEDLARLEDLNRETQSRLIEVQINPVEKYPQVSVIDRPAAESVRLGPDYLLWLGGSAAAALVLGVLSVWLYGFLSPQKAQPAYVTLSGVHMYPQDVSGNLAYANTPAQQLANSQAHLLASESSPQGETSEAAQGAEDEEPAEDSPDDAGKNNGDAENPEPQQK